MGLWMLERLRTSRRARISRSALLGATLAAGITPTFLAAAPDEPAATGETLDEKPRPVRSLSTEEIIVRVRKRAEESQKVPVSFSAIGSSQLAELSTRDLRDLEGQSPDLIVIPANATPGGGIFAIRGIGVVDIERSFDPAVGVFVDGVYLPSIPGSLLNTFDVQQIEIVRGPQSTLFGKNTIGGAILVNRTRPTGEMGVKGQVTLGSHGRNDYGGVVNVPVIENMLAAKFSVFRNNDEGAFKNATDGSRLGGDRFLSIGGDLLFTPTENLEFLLKLETAEDRRDSGPFVNIAGPGEITCAVLGFCGEPSNLERPAKNFSSAGDYDLSAITLETNYDLGSGLLTSITAWRASDERQAADLDGVPVDFFSTIRAQTARQWSQELRFSRSGLGPLDLVAGVYYIQSDYNFDQQVLFVPQVLNARAADIQAVFGMNAPPNQFAPGATRALQRAEQDSWSIAGFAQADYALTETVGLTAGARYTFEEKDFDAVGGQRIGAMDFFAPVASDDEDFDEWTGKIGLDWTPTENALLYAFYSKGFRSGGFNGRNTQPQDIGPYDTEKLRSLEAGLKSSWLDSRLTLNAAIFSNQYDDKQEQALRSDPLLGTLTVVENAADADIWGWELESNLRPIEGLSLSGKLAYLDAEYDNFFADLDGPSIDARCPTAMACLIPVDNSDLDIRLAPDWQWSLGAQYEIPIGSGLLTLSGRYRYVDNFQTDPRGDARGDLDDIGIADASISYSFDTLRGRYTVRLFGKNLGNVVAKNAATIIPGSFAFAEVDEGATYGITFEFDWR